MFIAVEVHGWLLGLAGGGGWCRCMKRFPRIHFRQRPFLHAHRAAMRKRRSSTAPTERPMSR